MKTVLIADDHTIVRLGILLVVKSMFLNAEVTEAETLAQVITQLEAKPFDLLILDINLQGGNNLQMIDAVRLRQPAIKILMFSGYEEQLFALNYIQAGADGYLVKDSSEEEIRTALRTVMNNEKYLSAAVKDQLISRLHQPRAVSANPLSVLSSREREVLNLLIKGSSVAKIAEMLHLQITTVSTYKTRVFEKMGAANLVELIEKVKLYSHPG
ncbi:response regulator transcription factor [Chitinophaga agrisoli]|uniref:Response regulator transcription factor n=1 Tax=Chitinophaga agrisoli TaxID=2607653 RepID=A0A5B2VUM3_9BACT|nr:response regulator transcription factor [Chitinophaga agrisoli]KAA2242775.1 response regulator transcription factor [Chitinophaga agrisoli]